MDFRRIASIVAPSSGAGWSYVSVVLRGGGRWDLAYGPERTPDWREPPGLTPWTCAARPVLALVLCRLLGDLGVPLTAPVSAWIPEYAVGGKEHLTIIDVLTHHTHQLADQTTSRFKIPWAEALSIACAERSAPCPGGDGDFRTYQPGAYWYIVAELVQRMSGRDLREYWRDTVRHRLGMPSTFFGMSPDELKTMVPHLETVRSDSERGDEFHKLADRELVLGKGPMCPRGPTHDLATFYATFLDTEHVHSVLGTEYARVALKRQQRGLCDRVWSPRGGRVVDWCALGMVQSHSYGKLNRVFGRFATENTFGHHGEMGTFGFCDMDRGVAVAVSTAEVRPPTAQFLRVQNICNAIYRDLEEGNLPVVVGAGTDDGQ